MLGMLHWTELVNIKIITLDRSNARGLTLDINCKCKE